MKITGKKGSKPKDLIQKQKISKERKKIKVKKKQER